MVGQNKKKTVFTISQLADEFGLSTRTIRFYEEKGLLAPERTDGGHRVFSRKDRARLKLILRGKRFGHSLEEIADMIGYASAPMTETEQINKTLEYGDKNLQEIQRRIHELKTMANEIQTMKKRLQNRLKEINEKGDL